MNSHDSYLTIMSERCACDIHKMTTYRKLAAGHRLADAASAIYLRFSKFELRYCDSRSCEVSVTGRVGTRTDLSRISHGRKGSRE